jgi:hypothetical protein
MNEMTQDIWNDMGTIARRRYTKREAERILRSALRITHSTSIHSHMNSKARTKAEQEAYAKYLTQIEQTRWLV